MQVQELNRLLAQGIIDEKGQFPQLERLHVAPFQFKVDFGLSKLPTQDGILLIRGARQYGKSTWLQAELKKTVKQYGPGTAYYLNGEYISDAEHLEQEIMTVVQSFEHDAKVRRLFIDEITAVSRWELVLKRLADQGQFENILVVTTGSKATDLRRAHERLPGRRGKLARTTYLFTPLPYKEFHRVCGGILGKKTLLAYLLSGGSPIACSSLAAESVIPEYVVELTRDWIEGEVSASGRSRAALLNIMTTLFRYAGTPVGQAKLAREAGLANNTVAAAYVELLQDLCCVTSAFPWDNHKKILLLRKPCKYHFTNLLAALCYHPARLRSVDDFLALPPMEQGNWYEWLVSQELLRRAVLSNADFLGPLAFWQGKENEIDFYVPPHSWYEVKRGQASPLDFSWFARQFQKEKLIVISNAQFKTDSVHGTTLEAFLLDGV